MNREKLRSLLIEEGPRIEWKEQINLKGERAKREFVKDLIAMVNSSTGDGYILYGISDIGQVVGIQRRKGLTETLQQIASSRCQPPVEFSCEWVEMNDKDLFIIHIPESESRPHATSQRDVYVRRQKIVDKATLSEIRKMMLRKLEATEPESMAGQAEGPSLGHDRISLFPDISKYDLNFFPITGVPKAYRSCKKFSDFDMPDLCPVFAPQFGIFSPEPEFGDTRSIIYVEWEGNSLNVERRAFRVFIESIEERVSTVVRKAGAWDCSPLSWSFSRRQEMDYGLGAENACLAIETNGKEGLFGGIIQFERASVYKPTNFFAFIAEIYPRGTGIFLRRLALKLILSSIPISNDWISDLFDVTEILDTKFPLGKPGKDVLNESLHVLRWIPQPKDVLKPDLLGLLGRDPGSSPEFDQGLGVVIDTKSLKRVKFSIDQEDSWNWEYYADVFKVPPSSGFDEIPVQITNPIPIRKDLCSKDLIISIPTMREVVIELAGFFVIAINAHSFMRRP